MLAPVERTPIRRAARASLGLLAACSLLAACPADPPPVVPTPPVHPTASSVPATPAQPSIPLFLAADGFDARIAIHPLEGRTLVSSTRFLAEVQGDAVVPHPEWIAGIEKVFEGDTLTFGGRFPDAAWLAATDDESMVRWSVTAYRFQRDRFVEVHRREELGPIVEAILPFSEGRVIALRQNVSHNKLVVDVLSGEKGKLPEPVALPDGASRLLLSAGAALPTGELFAYGLEWGAPEERLAVERWAHGASRGIFDLPRAGDGLDRASPAGLWVRSATEAWVAATLVRKAHGEEPYLARFDGTAWTPVAAPVDANLERIAGAPDGTLCVVGRSRADAADENEAWCRPPGGSFQRLSISDGHALVRQVWPRSAGDIWVSASVSATASGANRLYRSVKAASVFHATPSGVRPFDLEPFHAPVPGFAGCSRLFALLFSMGKATPANYDYPSTRAALKGHTELTGVRFVETVERGRRAFGAFVQSHETGTKLVALVKEKVAGSTPRLLCKDPVVWRELPIDLATGELRQAPPR
jgi:hypothetical protein